MALLKHLLETFKLTGEETQDGESDRADPVRAIVHQIAILAEQEGMSVEQMTLEVLQSGVAERRVYHRALRLWHSLTDKEKEVAALICQGLSNDEIAQRLFIARGTVRTHVRHILQKFKVNNRSEVRELLWWWDFSEWVT